MSPCSERADNLSMKAAALFGALVLLSGCGHGPCGSQRIVSAIVDGDETSQVEVDDGHVYSLKAYAPSYVSGMSVDLCDVISKIDGSHRYSI